VVGDYARVPEFHGRPRRAGLARSGAAVPEHRRDGRGASSVVISCSRRSTPRSATRSSVGVMSCCRGAWHRQDRGSRIDQDARLCPSLNIAAGIGLRRPFWRMCARSCPPVRPRPRLPADDATAMGILAGLLASRRGARRAPIRRRGRRAGQAEHPEAAGGEPVVRRPVCRPGVLRGEHQEQYDYGFSSMPRDIYPRRRPAESRRCTAYINEVLSAMRSASASGTGSVLLWSTGGQLHVLVHVLRDILDAVSTRRTFGRCGGPASYYRRTGRRCATRSGVLPPYQERSSVLLARPASRSRWQVGEWRQY